MGLTHHNFKELFKMTQKVNGAAYAGIWVEKQVTFVKITFSKDITALPAADLVVLGTTTPAGVGTVADSSFGVVESVMVQALKTLETKATVLGISKLDGGTTCDVMLGYAEGWFSDVAGLIGSALPVINAQAVVTTAGAAPTDTVGETVGVSNTAVTFDLEFAAWNGTMPVATFANGDLDLGPGATSGATPTNSPTGTPGYYPFGLPY
jgi:hypothetical protein